MPRPTIEDASEVIVHGKLFGQDCNHVWGVQTAPTPTSADLTTICGIFQTAYVDIMSTLSQDYSVGFIEAKYLGAAPAPTGSLAISPPQLGGSVDGSSPGNVALCASLHSGFSGRSSRGRKFFSGIPEGKTSENIVSSDVCDAVLLGINDTLIPALVSNGTPLVVVSFTLAFATVIALAICTDAFVDSQRRRLTGRGH